MQTTGSEPNPSLCKALFEHGMLGNGKVVQFLCFFGLDSCNFCEKCRFRTVSGVIVLSLWLYVQRCAK